MEENNYTIDLTNVHKVHFMGIGGISMSGLAEILLDAGFPVSGSDAKKSPLTEPPQRRMDESHLSS